MRLLFEQGQSIEWQTKKYKQTSNDLQNGHKTNYDLQNGHKTNCDLQNGTKLSMVHISLHTKLSMVHIALHTKLKIDQNESH
jgi:hypothetical protein